MAKYELPQYQSMYVDPQSVAINTELRTRFIDSFAADDTLQATVDGMEVADFDGDINKKNQLADQYNEQIRTRAERGDYETLGMSISRDARNFIKDYTPLQRNKAQYDNYIKTIEEAEKVGAGKPGGIDSTTATKLKEYAVHNYNGLEYDEQGNLNSDSYFDGPGFVGEVDEYALIKDEMSDVVAREWENMGTDIPAADLAVDANGKLQIFTQQEPGGLIKYFVRTKYGQKEIDANLVATVTDRVMQRNDVQGAFSQRALLDTYNLDEVVDDQGTTKATAALNAQEATIMEEIQALNAKQGTLSASEETQLNNLENQLNELQAMRSAEGDMATMRSIDYNNKVSEFYQSNIDKYAYRNIKTGEEVRYTDEYKNLLKGETDNPYTNTSIITEAQQIEVIGGNTAESKLNFIESTNELINLDINDLANEAGLITQLEDGSMSKLTDGQYNEILDEILDIDNAEQFEQIGEKYNMSGDAFKDIATRIRNNHNKKVLVETKIKEGELELFGDDYNSQISEKFARTRFRPDGLSEYGGGISGLELKDTLVQMGLIDKNASVKDAIDYYTKSKEVVTGPAGTAEKALSIALAEQIMKNRGIDLENDERFAATTQPLALAVAGFALRDMQTAYVNRDIDGDGKKDADQLNDLYAKDIKTDTGFAMNWFGTKEDSKKVQQAFERQFNQRSSWAQMQVYDPREDSDTYGELISAEELFDKLKIGGNEDIIVDNKNVALSSTPRADGTSTLIIPIELENGETMRLVAPSDQLKNPEMDKWVNSAEYQAATIWQSGVQANVKMYSPPMFDGVTFLYNENPPKIYIEALKKKVSKREGLAYIANSLHSAGFNQLHNSRQTVDSNAFKFLDGESPE
jgi:hypothetical protein